jgi:hypothetical protein
MLAAPARGATGWTSPVAIGGGLDSADVSYPLFEGPSMTVDPLGPVSIASAVCGSYQVNSNVGCTGSAAGLQTYGLTGGSWQGTGHLPDAAWQDTAGDPYMIASGANGDQVMVYMGCTLINPPGSPCQLESPYETFAVFARQRTSGTAAWSDPIQISDDNTSGGFPEVVVDKDGNASIAWESGSSPLVARELSADGTLGPIQTIAGTTTDGTYIPHFSLAGDPDGHAVLTYYYLDNTTSGIQAATLSGDWSTATGPTWSTPTTLITNPGAGSQFPVAGIGPNGRAAVVWEELDGSPPNLEGRMQDSQGNWGSVQTVPDSSGALIGPGYTTTALCAPRIARDDAGDLIMAWEQTSPTDASQYSTMVASLPASASSWTTQTLAAWAPSQNPGYSMGGCANAAMNGEGDAVVAWNSETDANPVQLNAAVAPAGKGFGTPVVLNDDNVEQPTPYNNTYQDLLPNSAVIDSHGIATVAWLGRDLPDNALLMASSTTTPLDGTGPASTTTKLTVSPNPSQTGQQVTYTATVSPTPDGGTIAFTDNGNPISGCGTVSPGDPTCKQTYNSPGPHTIKATYSGDTNFAGSSDTATEIVDAAGAAPTSTTLTSSANPAGTGQQVTYTATVTPTPDGGTIEFTDGGNPISGCDTVSTSNPICKQTYGSGGSHSIQAIYSGDTSYDGSLSNTINQTVNGYVLHALTPSPGRSGNPTCTLHAVMPSVLGLEEDPARQALAKAGIVAGPNVTVIERAVRKPPPGVHDVGQVYSETPKAGTRLSSCTTTVRLAIYGGPTGLTRKSYKKLKTLVGRHLDVAQDLTSIGWKLDYHFKPGNVTYPIITGKKLLPHDELQLDVTMPQDQSYYAGRFWHGGPGVYKNGNIPSIGIDQALSAGMQNLFGESVWSGNAPVAAQIVVDTHEVGDALSSSDNLHVSQVADTTSPPWQAGYLPGEPHIDMSPVHRGHVYVVAFLKCPSPDGASTLTCYAMDSLPVVTRSGEWDAMNGYKYSANGGGAGPIPGFAAARGAAADLSARTRAHTAGDTCNGDFLCEFSRFKYWITHPQWGTESTIGQTPSAPPSVVGTDGKLGDVQPGQAAAPQGTPVYDLKYGLYPMLDSSITGLRPGRVYEVENGQAVDLLDDTAHQIIAAGSANLQPGEVFGVYHIIAAGGADIIAAGGANFVRAWPVLDANAYNLAPGTYQINRQNGQVVATKVGFDSGGHIVAAGGANIVAAGGANIIAAGSANLADGYYNIVGAGGGNIVAAGSGNIIDYNTILSVMPEVMGADAGAESAQKGSQIAFDADHLLGAIEKDANFQPIQSLTQKNAIVTPGGNIVSAGSANIVAAGGANIVAAGAANIVAAGSGNIVAAGGAN